MTWDLSRRARGDTARCTGRAARVAGLTRQAASSLLDDQLKDDLRAVRLGRRCRRLSSRMKIGAILLRHAAGQSRIGTVRPPVVLQYDRKTVDVA